MWGGFQLICVTVVHHAQNRGSSSERREGLVAFGVRTMRPFAFVTDGTLSHLSPIPSCNQKLPWTSTSHGCERCVWVCCERCAWVSRRPLRQRQQRLPRRRRDPLARKEAVLVVVGGVLGST